MKIVVAFVAVAALLLVAVDARGSPPRGNDNRGGQQGRGNDGHSPSRGGNNNGHGGNSPNSPHNNNGHSPNSPNHGTTSTTTTTTTTTLAPIPVVIIAPAGVTIITVSTSPVTSAANLPSNYTYPFGITSFVALVPAGALVNFTIFFNCSLNITTVFKSTDGGNTYAPYTPQADGTGFVLGCKKNITSPDAKKNCSVTISIRDNGRGDTSSVSGVILDPFVLAAPKPPPVTTTTAKTTTTTTKCTTTTTTVSPVLITTPAGTTIISSYVSLSTPSGLPANYSYPLGIVSFVATVPVGGLVNFTFWFNCSLNITTVFKSTDGVTYTPYTPAADGTGYYLGCSKGGTAPDSGHKCAITVTIKDNGRGDSSIIPGVVSDPLILAHYIPPTTSATTTVATTTTASAATTTVGTTAGTTGATTAASTLNPVLS